MYKTSKKGLFYRLNAKKQKVYVARYIDNDGNSVKKVLGRNFQIACSELASLKRNETKNTDNLKLSSHSKSIKNAQKKDFFSNCI